MEEMRRVTLEIVCTTLFGFEAADYAEIRGVVQTPARRGDRRVRASHSAARLRHDAERATIRRAIGYMNRLLDSIIDERRTTRVDKGDLLSMLLLAVDDEGDGRGMSNQQARDEAMTLLLAGHETTATTLVWTFYLLAEHPVIQERIRAVGGGDVG